MRWFPPSGPCDSVILNCKAEHWISRNLFRKGTNSRRLFHLPAVRIMRRIKFIAPNKPLLKGSNNAHGEPGDCSTPSGLDGIGASTVGSLWSPTAIHVSPLRGEVGQDTKPRNNYGCRACAIRARASGNATKSQSVRCQVGGFRQVSGTAVPKARTAQMRDQAPDRGA